MANRSTKKSLERFKYEVADELGVPLSNGYNGNLTAKQNGSVGGYMVKKMIEEDRYCDDVLIQLSAIDKSIKSLANIILDDHMHSCLIENIKNGNYEAVDEIVDLFKRFQ